MIPALVDSTINQLLDDQANEYENLDEQLYPELP